MNLGLNNVAIKLKTADIANVPVIKYTKYSPRKSTSIPEKIAIGIVISPLCFIGIINNRIPIIEGIINLKLSFKVTLLLSSDGFKFEISILSPLYLYM